MKSVVNSLETTKVALTVEVEYPDLKPVIAQAYKTIAGQVNVPGFRKGKVPPQVIDRRFGREVVLEQAVNDGLNRWYRTALDEHNINPMAPPQIELDKEPDPAAAEPDLAFTATVEVRPEIVLPDLTALKVEVPDVKVTDQDVELSLEGLQERFGSLKTVDRPAKDGDFVTLDLVAEINGEEIDSVNGVSYQLGSGRLLEGIDEALDGLTAGETTTFESEMAGGDHAGEKALVTVTPTAVKERELPTLDDDFAQEASEFDTLDELKSAVRQRLQSQMEQRQVLIASDTLIKQLLDTLDFAAPSGVVQTEVERHLERTGQGDNDEARQAAETEAITEVRTQLLMDALVEKLEVRANQSELASFLIDTAGQYGMDAAQFIEGVEKQGELPHFYAELVRRKAAVKALRLIKVTTESGEVLDIAVRLGPEEAEPTEASGEVNVDGGAGIVEDLTAAVDHDDVDQVAIEMDAEEDEELDQ